MTTTLNWSERPEPNAASLRDCTYAAGLTATVYGGWTKYPLGIYTVAEREALERSDDQANETGASLSDLKVALHRRYGIDRTLNSAASLSALLDKPGIGLVVQGKMGNLAAGGSLRRWDPGYTGGHAVFVFRTSAATYRWLDPLAPMKFAGDNVSKTQIIRFAEGLGGSMTFKSEEFAPIVVAPPTYTQAQMDAVTAQRDSALVAKATAEAELTKATARLAAIRAAGGW